jgi:hypothetical protein
MTPEQLTKKITIQESTLVSLVKSISNLNQHVYELNRKVKVLEAYMNGTKIPLELE